MKEKKPMKKGVKVFLAVLASTLVVAICFGCVGLYLWHENHKPEFELPPIDPLPSASALPETQKEAVAYLERLYQAAVTADDVEGAWHTDVHLGELQTPLKEADHALVQMIREQSGGQIAALYPSASELVMAGAQDVPVLDIEDSDITDFSVRQGEVNEEADTDDSGFYYLDFTFTPQTPDAEATKNGDVYQGVAQLLAPAVTIEAFSLEPAEEIMNCRVDRVTDDLLSVTKTKRSTIRATVRLTDDYKALYENETFDVTLPYETVESISFSHYGARFMQQQMAVRKNDMKALPASVVVHSTATREDYTLAFDTSVPDVLKIDQDGVMTVEENYDEPITVTMTLEYDGHTYSDTLTVYITELEVKTDV